MTELTQTDKDRMKYWHSDMGVEGSEILYLQIRIMAKKAYLAQMEVLELKGKLAKVREAIE